MTSAEIIHGDCLEVMRAMPDASVDAVITDPPYGTHTAKSIYGRRREGKVNHIANDRDLSALEGAAPHFARLLKPNGVAIVCCAPTLRRAAENAIEAGGLNPIHSIPWDKGSPGISYRVRYAYEDAILAVHGDYDPWETRETLIVPLRVPRVRQPEHPNEKPVALLARMIEWACPKGGMVLDPFAGSASCGVAAVSRGCSYIGIECDEQWLPIARRRIADVTWHASAPALSFFTEGVA